MKNEFFEYTMSENGYIDEVLKNSIIVLDANALLNLYRLSDENREKYFDVLEKVSDRLFLTHQSTKEFFKNRLNICHNKLKFKENLKNSLESEFTNIKNKITNSNFQGEAKDSCNLIKHESELQDRIIAIIDESINKIGKEIDNHKVGIDKEFISNDTILNKILDLFNDKVNKPFKTDKLKEICEQGKTRYEDQIPPGYKDQGKQGKEQFGDLIIWKEMEEISKMKNVNILFVSDDRKEDWCEKFKGTDIGPRKELIKEFYENTNKLFYSITMKDFIKSMSEIYAIEETEKLQEESDIIYRELSENNKQNEVNLSKETLKKINYDIDELNDYQFSPHRLDDFDAIELKENIKNYYLSRLKNNQNRANKIYKMLASQQELQDKFLKKNTYTIIDEKKINDENYIDLKLNKNFYIVNLNDKKYLVDKNDILKLTIDEKE